MDLKIIFFRLSFVLFFLIPLSLSAQKSPIKYGKIEKADLEMKVYPSDTSAAAAVLCDFGYFDSQKLEFTRTIRIKIFKKEGTTWGNQVFPFSSEAFIKGITFNLENGEIVESKLKSESIFKENVTKNLHRKRVAMPNVKEGSILDMQFTWKGLPSEWRFQEDIPVKWSELIIESSPYLKFRKNFFGFVPLSESTDTRWIAKEVPAFKKEPYMNAAQNYMSKFEIELLNVSIPGYYKEYSSTWEAVNKTLNESEQFGEAIKGCPFLNKLAKDIEQNYTAPMDRLIAAHEAVKKAVKWNDRESIMISSSSLNVPFTKKIGNSADVNLILIRLLQKLDFEVYPVALSTRSNGFLSPVSPSFDKLNYVVAYVFLNDKKYFVDATEEFIPVGMLPQRCINLSGRIVDVNKSGWVELTGNHKDKEAIYLDLKLGADNALAGKITTVRYDYSALDFRNKYGKFNSREEYLKDCESSHKGLSILKNTITNLDSIYLPLKEESDIKVKNAVTTAGNRIYVNPMLYEQIAVNPFKSEDRKYPVDFICPSELTYVFKLDLPENTAVEEIPQNSSFRLRDGSIFVQSQAVNLGKSIQFSYRFSSGKSIYNEAEYPDLRAFFAELVKKHSEQIVLKTF